MVFGSKRKQRIMREQVKDRHTSHWDLDMLSHDELEKLMGKPSEQADNANHQSDPRLPKPAR
ncbi:MAG: hypothetical protein RKH07_08210 [Gammaproteobacteria bacterium]